MDEYSWKPSFEYDKVYKGGLLCDRDYVFKEKGFDIFHWIRFDYNEGPIEIADRIYYDGCYPYYDKDVVEG